uniref:Anaphase-promoting complex subunit 10 n=1 Tax=Angiostrongylus cantonensis TaxID=6313 RepID=A0A0K0DFE8_ANGCA
MGTTGMLLFRRISMKLIFRSGTSPSRPFGRFPAASLYWQSDGPQPHTVTIEFPKKTDICFVMMYLDFKNDESYTPSKLVFLREISGGNKAAKSHFSLDVFPCGFRIIVQIGSSLVHLDDGVPVEFNEPTGWEFISCFHSRSLFQFIDLRSRRTNRPSRAMVIQLQVVHNHQNGRDTHIRYVLLYPFFWDNFERRLFFRW